MNGEYHHHSSDSSSRTHKFYFDEKLIYNSGTEFSFEEIRFKQIQMKQEKANKKKIMQQLHEDISLMKLELHNLREQVNELSQKLKEREKEIKEFKNASTHISLTNESNIKVTHALSKSQLCEMENDKNFEPSKDQESGEQKKFSRENIHSEKDAESLVRCLLNGSLDETNSGQNHDNQAKRAKTHFSIYIDETQEIQNKEKPQFIETNGCNEIENVDGDLMQHISLDKEFNAQVSPVLKETLPDLGSILERKGPIPFCSTRILKDQVKEEIKEDKSEYVSAVQTTETLMATANQSKGTPVVLKTSKSVLVTPPEPKVDAIIPPKLIKEQDLPVKNALRDSLINPMEFSFNPCVYRGSMNYRVSEGFTMILPESDEDCVPKCASTPQGIKRMARLPSNNDCLSPIVENSREYKSSSSSSVQNNSIGTAASRRTRTFTPSSDIIDPFSTNLLQKLMEGLADPIEKRKKYYQVDDNIPDLVGTYIKLGDCRFFVESELVKGSCAFIYLARISESDGEKSDNGMYHNYFALKVCPLNHKWEFYICNELHKRLGKMKSLPDVEVSIMTVDPAVVFNDKIVLVDEFCPNGSLLDIICACKVDKENFPKILTAYFSLELMLIINQIHKCNIIHTNIRANNVLCLDFPNSININPTCSLKATDCLKLIDFRRAIDMELFQPDTCFTKASDFYPLVCMEICEDKAWSYQIDWFGFLDCVHLMLFNKFMEVRKDGNKWKIKEEFQPRHEQFYRDMFDELLNLSDCSKVDTTQFVETLKEFIITNRVILLRESLELRGLVDKNLQFIKNK